MRQSAVYLKAVGEGDGAAMENILRLHSERGNALRDIRVALAQVREDVYAMNAHFVTKILG